jgi:membrane protease YdiL (CAAX protease family)
MTAVSATAGFTEELIWRGYIITELEARGRGMWSAIVLAAISFALIHGIYFPVKLLVTFLLGIVAGYYYFRERKLIPLMLIHFIADLWSYGVTYLVFK